MLSKLVVGAASINLALSSYLVYDMVQYNVTSEEVELVAPTKPINTVEPEDKSSQSDSNSNASSGKVKGDEGETKESNESNSPLTESEKQLISTNRSPFSKTDTEETWFNEQQQNFQDKLKEIQDKIAEEKLAEEMEKYPERFETPDEDKVEEKTEEEIRKEEEAKKNIISLEDASKLAKDVSSNYSNIPPEWILAIMDVGSGFDAGLTTSETVVGKPIKREGLMQLRTEKFTELAEQLGISGRGDLHTSPTLNVELAAKYLDNIYKTTTDKNEIFTQYFIGEDFSGSILFDEQVINTIGKYKQPVSSEGTEDNNMTN